MRSFDFEFRMIPFNDLRPDPTNIRTKRDRDDDIALKQSILVNGLIQPFIVCKDDKSGYLIVDGHRTHDASREIFKNANPEVPCVVISKEATKQFTVEELRKNRLLREIHTQKINDWDRILAVKLYADDLKAEKPDITQKEIAGTLGKKQSWLSQIITTVINGTFAPAIEMGEISYERSRVIKKAPENAQKALIDATKDFTLHDTERIVKQVSMGVRIDEAIRAVKLSHTPELQVKDAEVKERFPEEDASQKLTSDKDHSPSASETPELPVNDGEDETTEEAVEKDDDSGREPLQPSSPETTGIVAQTLGIEEKGTEESVSSDMGSVDSGSQSSLPEGGIEPVTPDVVPPPETKKKEKISPVGQVLVDLDKTYKKLEMTQKHINQDGFNGPETKAGRKNFEISLFAIQDEVEAIAKKLFDDGSDEKGGWGFCQLKRITHPLKDFDFHAIGPKDCPDARSMIIETQKRFTKGLNIVDNIAKTGG